MDSEKLICFNCTFTEAVQDSVQSMLDSNYDEFDKWCKNDAANSFADEFEDGLKKVTGLNISDLDNEDEVFRFCCNFALAVRTYFQIKGADKLSDFIESFVTNVFDDFQDNFDFITWND